MAESKEEVPPASSESRRRAQVAQRSRRFSTNTLLQSTIQWLRWIRPSKSQTECKAESSCERRRIRCEPSSEASGKRRKTLTLYNEDTIVAHKTLNLYEAFGTTAKKTVPGCGLEPLLVVEVMENGTMKSNLVPYKHSMEGKWLLYGKRVYVFKGHSFTEHKASPTFVSCLLCMTTGFRIMQNFFQCSDCEYVCHILQESTVKENCPVAKILTQEMCFPYDIVEPKPGKAVHCR
ncbi:hypothetical protein CDAR_606571 [Caerostris darwini]|uniref:Phorbol-ester/DAG-type domain-containing protein n=1 Tax=Caerostris darwini TaxID=1538125 RepID=A0AAV4PCS2_9ARAC|nr:hypothetical protein CDAR_606571 [Caerostris darwini]